MFEREDSSEEQMGMIPPRLGDGAISQLGMREFISKYEEYTDQTPEDSTQSVKVLVKGERLEDIIYDENNVSEVPLGDASEVDLIKALTSAPGWKKSFRI